MTFIKLASGLEVTGMSRGKAEMLEYQTLDYFRHGIIVAPCQTIIDVGANFGFFAMTVLTRTGGTARVICVEPAMETAAALKQNLIRNFPAAATSITRKGLSSSPGTATFYYRPAAPERSSLLEQNDVVRLDLTSVVTTEAYRRSPYAQYLPPWLFRVAPRFIQWVVARASQRSEARLVPQSTEVATLDQVFADEQLSEVHLLKIDVEGAEMDVLAGLSDENARRIQQIVAEVHDIDGRVATFKERLATWGFTAIVVDQELFFQGSNIFNVYARRS